MQFIKLEKVKDGNYLKNYVLAYENKAGKEKKFEIVSHRELTDISDLGSYNSGVSIVALKDGKLLLLREFRMGINRFIYNMCAGMIEKGETVEECIRRELYEETGLHVKRIRDILPPSFSAPAISDIKASLAIVDVEGEFEDHSSENELIEAAFYTKEEVKELLKAAEFSSRAQTIAYFFAHSYFQ